MTYFKLIVIIFCFSINHISFSKNEEISKFFLSEKDQKIFNKALKAGDRRKWSLANKNAKDLKNSEAKKIIKWRWLIANDGMASNKDLKFFYNSNKKWPRLSKIKKKIEAKLKKENYQESLLWFQDNPPVTGIGKIKFSELLLKNNLNTEGIWLIENAWQNHNYSSSEEKYILKKYGKYLSEEIHNLRLERLIWNKTWGSARRQLKRVNKDIRNFSNAKILLSRRKGNVDNAIKKINKKLITHETLIYERIKWRRKAKLEKKSYELLYNYKGNYSRPKKWWTEINYHSRKQISYGNYEKAITILKNFNNGTKDYSSEASWLIGWLSLTFEKNPKTAYEYFKKMFDEVITPISKSRASYWAGKSAKSIGDTTGAKVWFARSSDYPATFYGQLALKELGKSLYMPDNLYNISDKEIENFKSKELVKCLIILLDAKHRRLSRIFAMHIASKSKTTKDIMLLSYILMEKKAVSLSIFAGKKAIYNNIYIPSLNFPIPNKNIFQAIKNNSIIDISETLAISRQESAFDTKAISRAGARGLMQLMPRTARLTAKKVNYKYIRKNLTLKPSYNVKLGTSYFKEMLDKFNGSYILALASYNAGPNRVSRWLRVYGDPRKNEIDPVTWIELIPISETRNYVQRVIEGMYMYKVLLNSKSNLYPSKEIKLF